MDRSTNCWGLGSAAGHFGTSVSRQLTLAAKRTSLTKIASSPHDGFRRVEVQYLLELAAIRAPPCQGTKPSRSSVCHGVSLPQRLLKVAGLTATCGLDGQFATAKVNLGLVQSVPLYPVHAPAVEQERVTKGLPGCCCKAFGVRRGLLQLSVSPSCVNAAALEFHRDCYENALVTVQSEKDVIPVRIFAIREHFVQVYDDAVGWHSCQIHTAPIPAA